MGFILYCARFSVTLQPYNIYPNTMHRITLTYRHAAAPARHLQAGRVRPLLAVGAERFLPPPFIRLHRQPMPFRCRRKAVSGASVAAESYAPSQPLLRVHTIVFIIINKFNN